MTESESLEYGGLKGSCNESAVLRVPQEVIHLKI